MTTFHLSDPKVAEARRRAGAEPALLVVDTARPLGHFTCCPEVEMYVPPVSVYEGRAWRHYHYEHAPRRDSSEVN